MSSEIRTTEKEIHRTVRNYLLAEFLQGEDPTALTNETPLITGGILDSIGSVKLVSHLEETYGIHFEAHEVTVDCLNTIDRITSIVRRKLAR